MSLPGITGQRSFFDTSEMFAVCLTGSGLQTRNVIKQSDFVFFGSHHAHDCQALSGVGKDVLCR